MGALGASGAAGAESAPGGRARLRRTVAVPTARATTAHESL
ncbi:hypothetical protein BURPS1655_A2122 [Burkholderia pseudomallei 1655]|nr:hypothetical protein BURPS1655_A2122 [Burkholderia pseudomallei 1655]